jgi:hypothetical protein
VLCRLLRLPRAETESIREELAEHLRERIRDLMVEGVGEEAAAGRAIAELGDAAALADRFRRAERGPQRRMIMNIAMVVVACGAVIGGAVGLKELSGPATPAGVANKAQMTYASPEVAEKTITLPKDATLERIAQELGKVAGKQTYVDWDSLAAMDAAKDSVVGVPMASVSVETALMLLNERMGKNGERIACRVTGDMLEVSTLRHFDRRDITLMAYDASPLLDSIPGPKDRAATAQDLQKLITSVVDPEQWRENGGELAELYLVGTKLFVHAPARFQPTVQWILTQVGSGKAAGMGAPAADAAAGVIAGEAKPGLVYLTGSVQRPGAYSLPEGGLSVRAAILAAGTQLDHIDTVRVTESRDGKTTVVHELKGEDLRKAGGADPKLASGQFVEVK